MVLALVALWLPATLHCKLEELPGLQFLACCDHGESAPHQDDDCRTDSCAMVEEGLYKNSNPKVIVLPPVFVVVPDFSSPATADAQLSLLSLFQTRLVTDRAPELLVTWQFSSRAALPPRAPSFVS